MDPERRRHLVGDDRGTAERPEPRWLFEYEPSETWRRLPDADELVAGLTAQTRLIAVAVDNMHELFSVRGHAGVAAFFGDVATVLGSIVGPRAQLARWEYSGVLAVLPHEVDAEGVRKALAEAMATGDALYRVLVTFGRKPVVVADIYDPARDDVNHWMWALRRRLRTAPMVTEVPAFPESLA